MKNYKLIFDKVIYFNHDKFFDSRGFFMETFNKKKFYETFNINLNIKQNNVVFSKKNVLRGLHYQIGKSKQGKLVTVIEGELIDVVVDIRKGSKYYGKSKLIKLSKKNRRSLWVPAGFAHGYYTLSDKNIVIYSVDNQYNPKLQRSIKWDDKTLNIKWPIKKKLPILSINDRKADSFNNL